MLTVDFGQFPVAAGERVLDLGCGFGRHAFEAYRRGAHVVAVDRSPEEVASVTAMFRAMEAEGEAPGGLVARAVRADLLALPFPDASFDVVMASEVLEHIPADELAMAEIARVVRPGGRVAVTVPRWWPERVCWALSRDYHDVAGGHVRIYRGDQLEDRLRRAGLQPRGSHHAHALHAPYWWLNCALGKESAPSRLYHRVLVWDILKRPWVTRVAEQALNPVLGKSLVVYADKPMTAVEPASAAA
ncbi:MAG TPA: class I SAM-dependent methyltransferase [Mycobacteriales bacterium]|nr:class I SAM-dependent methyltransferase [Mycobacteriales bacterium]